MKSKLFLLVLLIPFLFLTEVDAKKKMVKKKTTTKVSKTTSTSKGAMVSPDQGDFGAGVQLGGLTGGTAKYFLSKYVGLVATIGYDWGDSSLGAAFDGLYHFRDMLTVKVPEGALFFYTGVGGRFTFNKSIVYLRVPLGINYFLKDYRVGTYLELVPGYRLNNNAGFDFDWALGARYYFD
ncbi:MAG: hypothetical protein HYW47_01105 [Deltaproteobacteria bacterium]|nr:hypothetical protein [Deltaproteobacteria bacterium]